MKEKIYKGISKFPAMLEIIKFLNQKTIKKYKRKKIESVVHSMTYKQYEEMDAGLYKTVFGKPINFSDLHSYSEKMQWAKIYDQDSRKTVCADKYAVRDYVKGKIGEEYLIPLLGAWDKYSEIEFKKLPNQFVLKTNCGSGELTIVKDITKLSFNEKLKMRRRIEESLCCDFSTLACEYHYSKIPKKIIAEKLIVDSNGELNDYKFMCFNGKPQFVWIDTGRFSNHRRNIYDLEWNLLPFTMTFPNTNDEIKKPENFSDMIEIAAKLSNGFSHVRIDLYNVDGKIYFGEMTFTSNAGFEKCIPEEYDRIIGDLWLLDKYTDKNPFDMVYERNRYGKEH